MPRIAKEFFFDVQWVFRSRASTVTVASLLEELPRFRKRTPNERPRTLDTTSRMLSCRSATIFCKII